jgi:chemotaxis protein MotB
MTEPVTTAVTTEGTTPKTKVWPLWLGIAGTGLVAGLILFQVALPARKERDALTEELQRVNGDLASAKGAAKAQEALLSQLLADKDNLAEQKFVVQEQLTQAITEKETAITELERARKELSDALGTQISSGDVLIQERKGELVIDVSDRLLFDSGETAVNDTGKAFLREVAKTMRHLSAAQVFRVGGHTDTQRIVTPELAERYPTNWELSTARASNVVRSLQEDGKVPGHQLIAAGFSQYRPVSSNQSDSGRQKNRRIEIVLQRIHKNQQ